MRRFATLLGSIAFLGAQGAGSILPAHAQQRQHRVLVLYADGNTIPAAMTVGETVRKRLDERFPQRVQLFHEFLDLSRFPNEAHKARVLRFLAEKYADTRPDVLLAAGPDALQAAIDSRGLLAPTTPIVFCCTSPARLATIELPADATGIITEFDLPGTVALARRLQPDARRLVVIAGAAPFDLRWAEIARAQLDADWEFDASYLVGLTREALLDEVRKLPRDTIVLVLTVLRDGAGRDFVPSDMAQEIATASGAPVYAPYDTYIGRGVVGGRTDTFEAIGVQTSELVSRILGGEDAKTIAPRISTTRAFRVDARQLARWGLSADNLPNDTVVLYRTPSVWEQHRHLVLGAIAAFLLQTAFLVLVLAQMRRRRLTERLLRRSEERLETIQDEERARIARDLHDSTAQHLTAASLSLARLREDVTLDPDARNALEDAKGSLREAASELRDYAYLLHPPALRRDGLDCTLQRYVEDFGKRTGLTTKIGGSGGGNDLSLAVQRSVLRIVQGALANVHDHATASRVSIKLKRVGKRLHLLIVDDGRGIEAAHGDVERPGMGIQAMVSRVGQFGGRLSVRSRARGTAVLAVIPISTQTSIT